MAADIKRCGIGGTFSAPPAPTAATTQQQHHGRVRGLRRRKTTAGPDETVASQPASQSETESAQRSSAPLLLLLFNMDCGVEETPSTVQHIDGGHTNARHRDAPGVGGVSRQAARSPQLSSTYAIWRPPPAGRQAGRQAGTPPRHRSRPRNSPL